MYGLYILSRDPLLLKKAIGSLIELFFISTCSLVSSEFFGYFKRKIKEFTRLIKQINPTDHKGISPYNTFWGPWRYFITPWRYQICIAGFLYSYKWLKTSGSNMWTKSLPKKGKSKPPVDVRRSKTPLLKLPNIASRYMWVKKMEMAKGMGKDKREPKICIMETFLDVYCKALISQFWKV